MKMRYKVALLSITVLLICSIMLGTSYSIWTTSASQQGENVINVGCFKITYIDTGFENAGNINLTNEYPVTESVGAAKQPYKFKIKNECSVAASYNVNLEKLNGSTMDTNYLRVMINDMSSSIYETGFETVTPYLTDEAASAKRIVEGFLSDGEEVTYSLRLWIDYNADTTTQNVMGKAFLGKIAVYSEATTMTSNAYGVVSDGSGEQFSSFLISTDRQYITGVNPANYVSFNNELWRAAQPYEGVGVALVKAEPISGYTFDYDNLSSYSTSPFIKTEEVNGVQTTVNYYDTLTEEAKSMVRTHPFTVGTISQNSGNIGDVHASLLTTRQNLKVASMTVTNYIYTNSLSECESYNFGTDIGTRKCTYTSYAIGNQDVYTMTKGPNSLYIVSSKNGIREKTTETDIKILPLVLLTNDVLVTDGNGTINFPYVLQKP